MRFAGRPGPTRLGDLASLLVLLPLILIKHICMSLKPFPIIESVRSDPSLIGRCLLPLRLGITRVVNLLGTRSPIALSTTGRVIESLRALWKEMLAPWKNK